MKVLVVVKTELRHKAETPDSNSIGVAESHTQVKDMIEKALASRENSQKLESWIHPTILSFHVDEREIGVYFSHRTYRVWTKEAGFLPCVNLPTLNQA